MGFMETTTCPFCLEEIKIGAIKCKHCRSTLVSNSLQYPSHNNKEKEEGTLWLPVSSLVLGLICFLAGLDVSTWNGETFLGAFMSSVTGIGLGTVSVSIQKRGRGMAVAGIILCGFTLLGLIGLIVGA